MKDKQLPKSTKPKIVCLTPVKNEAWILDLFLKSASLWADHIIIADQMSDDGSREIALKYPKVVLVDNKSTGMDEKVRQALLIDEARKIPGDKILLALDADEFLSLNDAGKDWSKIARAGKGTVIKFRWVNLLLDRNKCWESKERMPFGFVDDGTGHTGSVIHSTRIPLPSSHNCIIPDNLIVMHLQYADWERMKSKHRWYQCWEHIHNPDKSSISIYRQYHHMYSIKRGDLKNIPPIWLEGYEDMGINLKDFIVENYYRWDCEVLSYIKEFGANNFSRYDIWEKDWQAFNEKVENSKKGVGLLPQKTFFDRLIMSYLRRTQPSYSDKNYPLLFLDKILKVFVK